MGSGFPFGFAFGFGLFPGFADEERGCKTGARAQDMGQGPRLTIFGDREKKSRKNAGLGSCTYVLDPPPTVNFLVLLGGVKTLGGVSISEKLASSLPETESVRGGPKALGGVRPRTTTLRNIRETKDSTSSFRRIRPGVLQKQKPLGGVESR